jgi:hypothetical protein
MDKIGLERIEQKVAHSGNIINGNAELHGKYHNL